MIPDDNRLHEFLDNLAAYITYLKDLDFEAHAMNKEDLEDLETEGIVYVNCDCGKKECEMCNDN